MRKQSWSSCFRHLLPFVSMLDTGCCSPCSAWHTGRQFNDDFHTRLFRYLSAVPRAEQFPVFLTNLEGKVGKVGKIGKVGKVGRVGKVGKEGKEGRLRE